MIRVQYFFTAWLLALSITGCSVISEMKKAQPKTANESFLLSFALVESSYQILMAAIQNPSVELSKAQAQEIKDKIDVVHTNLSAAYSAYQLQGVLNNADVFTTVRTGLQEIRTALAAFYAAGETP